MALLDDLNELREGVETSLDLRNAMSRLELTYRMLDECITELANVATEHPDLATSIKQEGNAVKTILETCKTDLQAHSDFVLYVLNYTWPT